MITRVRLWLRSLFLSRRLEAEMQSEMAEHLQRSTERLIARGLSPEAARREAQREFGNLVYLQEEGRIARGATWLDTLRADLRFALRHFLRTPLSTLTIVAVLSVGIGINVVLFTLVDSFTDRPPGGVEASDDRVRIRGSQLGIGGRAERAFTGEEVEGFFGLESHFSEVAAWTSHVVTATAPDVGEVTATATFVTDSYFSVLGVQPVLGPGLRSDDAQGALLSHTAWTRWFANDPNVLGRTITLNEVPLTVVGVAPPRFRGAYWEARNDLEVWLPQSSHRSLFPEVASEAELFRVIATLHPGVTLEAAGAAADVLARRTASAHGRAPRQDPSLPGRDASAEVVPLLADNLEPGFEANARFAKLTFGVLGLLTLLVTCANTSALQTGLGLARRREIAIRSSLGASRGRLLRQLVTESLLLSALAAVAAVGVSLVMFRLILGIVGTFSVELVFDGTTLAFTFGIALAAGLLFGLSPAVHAARPAIAGALKDSTGSIAGGRARLQRGLVVAQIALTQPLAVCVATLVVLGIAEYRANPANPYGDQIVQLRLASPGPQEIPITSGEAALERQRLETEQLIQALRQVPGITEGVYSPGQVPIGRAAFTILGDPQPGSGSVPPFYLVGRASMPGYLELIGAPILLGRDLEPSDTATFRGGAIPVIIGDDMARRLWGDTSPIGRRVTRVSAADEPSTLEVVGVYARSADASGHSRDAFSVFVPPDPRETSLPTLRTLLLRTSSTAETMMPVIRTIVRDEAPRTAITELRTLASVQDDARFVLWGAIALFSTGGLMVLLLSALGLYAVVSFAVGQRTGEIAVRLAIGALPRQVVRHFASDGLRLGVLGIVIGLPLSVLGLGLLMHLETAVREVSLPGVTSTVALGVLLVAGLATLIPASRAARVDPAMTLRRE